eukprot:6076426-Alexandrium_andersonii.AAC.1
MRHYSSCSASRRTVGVLHAACACSSTLRASFPLQAYFHLQLGRAAAQPLAVHTGALLSAQLARRRLLLMALAL